MVKVLLLSLAPENEHNNSFHRAAFTRLRESAERDVFKLHSLTDDPEKANLILFAEIDGVGIGLYFEEVRKHPYVKKYREKCFMFCQTDKPIAFLPGIYTSVEKNWYSSARVRSGFYLSVEENPLIAFEPQISKRLYLYSFIGAVNTSPIREQLQTIQHPRSFFQDTSKQGMPIRYRRNRDELMLFWKQFADICKHSKFILCPRGLGASSIRLFESMKLGRVPVIISDEWVPPEGPEWNKFSLRIAEKDISEIPQILEAQEIYSAEMGVIARKQWETWFSEEVRFHRVVEWCLDINKKRKIPESLMKFIVYAQFLRPFHCRNYLRTKVQSFRNSYKINL